MEAGDIQGLKKLLKMLREQGCTEFEGHGLKLKLGDLPPELNSEQDSKDMQTDPPMSDEEILLWSVTNGEN